MNSNQMKVILVPHNFQEHYAIGFANGVAGRGIAVDYICSDSEDTNFLNPSIKWLNLGQNTRSDRHILDKALRFIRYHTRLVCHVVMNRNAIVHVIALYRNEVVTGILEGAIFRLSAKKYVLTVHNLLPHNKHTMIKKFLYRITYKLPHYLIAHTEKMKKDLIEFFNVHPNKIVVMQHGINDIVPDHGKDAARCRRMLNLPTDHCILLFFGRLSPYKGLETLLEAYKKLGQQFYLIIAGTADKIGYGNKIKALIANHPCRERISFRLGYVENAEVATYFRAADALIMPYKHIDQSGIIFLAFRFGLPIVAFNVGAFDEYISDEMGLLINGSQTQDLVSGIERFYKNRHRFSPDIIRKHTQRYHWNNTLEPVIALYCR